MDTIDRAALGRFVWFDLMTPDVDEAVQFYGDVAGWDSEEWEGSADEPYTMITVDGQSIGGVNPIPAGQEISPNWMSYVSCADLDRTVEQATSLGGTLTSEIEEVAEVGRMVLLTDPTGAAFALYEPIEPPAASDEMPPVGYFSWHELATSDLERVQSFYSQLLNWRELDVHEMGNDMGTYWMFGPGERAIGGMYEKPPEMPGPANWLHYIRVAEMDAALAAVRNGGGEVMNGPMEVPGGDVVAQCTDPHGAFFALHAATGEVSG